MILIAFKNLPRILLLVCILKLTFGFNAHAQDPIDVGELRWPPVERASSYVVEIAKSKDFKDAKQYKVTEPTMRLDGYGVGIYFFRVAPVDEFDKVYGFSNPSKITIDTLPAVLKSPKNGLEIELKEPTLKMEFSWDEAVGLSKQTIQIATDKEFKTPVTIQEVSGHVFNRTFEAKSATYFWRIISTNPEKTKMMASDTFSFAVKLPGALSAPVLIAPADKKNFPGKDLADQKIKFEVAPIVGAKQYEFLISTEATFAEKETKVVTDTKNTVSVDLETNAYWWKARVKDSLGRVTESATKNSFQVQGRLSTPQILTNAQSSYFSGRLDEVPIFLGWTPSEKHGSYQVQISSQKNFKKIVKTETTKGPELRTNLKTGRYYIRVRAKADGLLDSAWSKPARIAAAKRLPWRHTLHASAGYNYKFIHSAVDTDQTTGSIDGSLAVGFFFSTNYNLLDNTLRLNLDASSASGTLQKESLGDINPAQKSAAIKAMNASFDARYYFIPQTPVDDLGFFVGLGYNYQSRTELTIVPGTEFVDDETDEEIGPALTTRFFKVHGPTLGLGLNYSITYSSELAFETKFILPRFYSGITGKSAYISSNNLEFIQVISKFLSVNLGFNFAYGKIKFDSTEQSGSDTFSEVDLQLGLGYFF